MDFPEHAKLTLKKIMSFSHGSIRYLGSLKTLSVSLGVRHNCLLWSHNIPYWHVYAREPQHTWSRETQPTTETAGKS